VTSVPTTISKAGSYCLTADIAARSMTGIAIWIKASDVRLDLGDRKIVGPGGATEASAIVAEPTAQRVSIKNGLIRGFKIGVNSQGALARVENVQVDRCTSIGIFVAGQGSLVRGNRVTNTTGNAAGLPDVAGTGIMACGPATVVEDNVVTGLPHAEQAQWGDELGIMVSGQGSVLRNNVVIDDDVPCCRLTYGISVAGEGVTVSGSIISSFSYGLSYGGAGTGTYSRNVVTGCTNPYTGGSAGSDND
jgi:hypothetical protein